MPHKKNVISFLKECIFLRFGYPRAIFTNQGAQIRSILIEKTIEKHDIHHIKSTPYHPQANEQVEVTNQELENILTKIVSMNKNN
jgi:transposase InsO family protein